MHTGTAFETHSTASDAHALGFDGQAARELARIKERGLLLCLRTAVHRSMTGVRPSNVDAARALELR